MLKKLLVGLVVAVLTVILVLALVPGKNASAPQEDSDTKEASQVQEDGVLPAASKDEAKSADGQPQASGKDVNPSGGQFSSEDDIMAPDTQVEEIVFDGKAFQPSNITIKAGDVVIFRNKSTNPFWPASAPHPKHTDYPEFDALKPIAAGQSFEFKFTKVGVWKFHDHLMPSAFGSVTVEK